jgi:hypothetical protein
MKEPWFDKLTTSRSLDVHLSPTTDILHGVYPEEIYRRRAQNDTYV